jgi:electron transfer flavoprotein alpha subunit
MSKVIVVWGQVRNGAPTRPTLECLSLAKSLGGTIHCVLLGSGAKGAAAAAGHQGADQVWCNEDASFDRWDLAAVANTLDSAIKSVSPALVLVPATTHGKELAAKLAARHSAALASEVIGVSLEGDSFKAVRPMYAGKVRATVKLSGAPAFATVRPNVLDVAAADSSRNATVNDLAAAAGDSRITLTAMESKADSGSVDLSEARVVVSGGRGLKGPENFHLIDNLASALGGAVGASRMVVDAGWKEHRYQVGQTGKVVTPELYVAVGISGAIQHLVGMQNSGCIVAINNSPDAPIFKVADYGIVADLFEFMPKLAEELKA